MILLTRTCGLAYSAHKMGRSWGSHANKREARPMDEKIVKQIAKRFAAARKQLGLTQQDVADKAKVSLGTINNLENGRSIPQSANRAAIVEVLGADIFDDDLADWARNGWPESVQTFTDVLGQYLASLPADERHALITKWMKEILRSR